MATPKKESKKFVIVWDSYGEAFVGTEDECKYRLDELVEYDGSDALDGTRVYELGASRIVTVETKVSF